MEHRTDVLCDFQQFYHLALPVNEDEFPVQVPERWALLWYGLPRESRTARRLDPTLEWADSDYMLRSIEYSTALNIWAKTKDAENGRNKPEPVLSPLERREKAEKDRVKAERERLARENLKRIYNIGDDADV